eukprot:scaffold6977_cov138-Isochrysis_galbana.AAC.1
MARAPNTAPLAGLAGHVSRTAARVISWSGQAEMGAEAWEAVRNSPESYKQSLFCSEQSPTA